MSYLTINLINGRIDEINCDTEEDFDRIKNQVRIALDSCVDQLLEIELGHKTYMYQTRNISNVEFVKQGINKPMFYETPPNLRTMELRPRDISWGAIPPGTALTANEFNNAVGAMETYAVRIPGEFPATQEGEGTIQAR